MNIRTVDEAVVIGAALSLSSSAFVLQVCENFPWFSYFVLSSEDLVKNPSQIAAILDFRHQIVRILE